jgi:threonine/homoserine/homoserine lactone efflux protein
MTFALVYQAFILVLLLSFSFGPAFFGLINTSIKYGFRAGVSLALGVFLSDLLLSIGICFLFHFGAEDFLSEQKNQSFVGIIGGIILIVFGVVYLTKKEIVKTDQEINIERPKPIWLATKGFFLNLFNPMVWPLWLGNVTAVGESIEPAYDLRKMILFFVFTLLGVLSADLLKVFVAAKIKRYVTIRLIRIVNWITGLSLLSFGLFLVYTYYFASHGSI